MSQRLIQQLAIAHLIFLLSLSARAYAPDYFTINETTSAVHLQAPATMDPVQTMSEVFEGVTDEAKATVTDLNLMSWTHHQEELPDPSQDYNRKKHFGTWVRDRNDNTCYNTRAKVLIRSSQVPVTLASHGCAVARGRWQDPYKNRQYTDASDIQIDHVVPLKNTYMSGAWKWDPKKRCLYANFLSNDYHLLAVNGGDNMKKGDRTPEKFMPDNEAFACTYLTIWLKIKLTWNLAMIPGEAEAITDLAQQHHCTASSLTMTAKELNEQRQSIVQNIGLCSRFN